MARQQTQALAEPSPPKGWGQGLALAALLLASVLATLLIVGIGRREVRPDSDRLVTVQQPSALDGVGNAAGPSEIPPPRGDTPGRRLGEGLRLVPRPLEGEVAYVVTAETDAALLAISKFRPGDVVMTMDGRPLDPARIEALGDELSLLDQVEVTFLREGAMRKRVIDLSS